MNKFYIFIILGIIIPSEVNSQNHRDSLLTSLRASFKLDEYDKASELIQYNNDTILFAGYLSDKRLKPRYEYPKNVIYKTVNGGKTWKIRKFNGDSWIYDSHHLNDGNTWIGGSDNYIYHSKNHGESWKKLIKPFKPVNRVNSIFMVNSEFRIAGGLSNGLAMTNDNWKTTIQIKSPLDQKKYQIIENSSRVSVNKVAIIDSIVLINQNDHIYYSEYPKIDWTEFNVPVVDFIFDKERNEIHLECRNNKFYVLSNELNLVRTYQSEDHKYERSNNIMGIENFFKVSLKSIEIKSKRWNDKKYDVDKIRFKRKGKQFVPVGKVNKNKHLVFTEEELKDVLHGNLILNLDMKNLAEIIKFDSLDFKDYKRHYEDLKKERVELQKWGGDFTSLLDLENELFENYYNVTDTINASHLPIIYKNSSLSFLFYDNQSNKIELKMTNYNNQILLLTNENSSYYSLPWTLEHNGKKTIKYNPLITAFLKSHIPADFVNYKMLLGGELIYKLIEQNILENLEYKKNE